MTSFRDPRKAIHPITNGPVILKAEIHTRGGAYNTA
jgi:hypothetical protein